MVDIQGTTHTVEPFEGGPIKRVHRSELRPCVKPVPKPRTKLRVQTSTQPVAEELPVSPDPDFVVVEEVFPPQLVQALDPPHAPDMVDVPVTASADELDCEGVNDDVRPEVSESGHHNKWRQTSITQWW